MMTNLHFDLHQFQRAPRPVGQHTGISWDDFDFMRTYGHKQSGERRLPTPEWVVNDALLREVIVAYLECRAQIGTGPGTPLERLARVRAALLRQKPVMCAALDRLCREYMSADRERKQSLQIEIENLDTRIRTMENPALLACVAYLYYRTRMDSVGVAEQLGMKPPHIRQVLYRMHKIADRVKNGTLAKPQVSRLGDARMDGVIASRLRKAGKTWTEIASLVGLSPAHACVEAHRAEEALKRTMSRCYWNTQRAIELYERGLSVPKISKALGVPSGTIQEFLWKYKLTRSIKNEAA